MQCREQYMQAEAVQLKEKREKRRCHCHFAISNVYLPLAFIVSYQSSMFTTTVSVLTADKKCASLEIFELGGNSIIDTTKHQSSKRFLTQKIVNKTKCPFVLYLFCMTLAPLHPCGFCSNFFFKMTSSSVAGRKSLMSR